MWLFEYEDALGEIGHNASRTPVVVAAPLSLRETRWYGADPSDLGRFPKGGHQAVASARGATWPLVLARKNYIRDRASGSYRLS